MSHGLAEVAFFGGGRSCNSRRLACARYILTDVLLIRPWHAKSFITKVISAQGHHVPLVIAGFGGIILVYRVSCALSGVSDCRIRQILAASGF